MKRQIIVMMGGQGVGKGTFSKMLLARHDFSYVETGAILRSMPPESDVARMIANGQLVPDEMLFDLIAQKMENARDVILDGFPRTLPQAQWLVQKYSDECDIHILFLHVSEEIMIQRINKRIREGGNRTDDASPEIIRRRLDTFQNITMPAVEWLRTAPGIRFSEIDVSGSADENFADIVAALRQ